jgi:hypothetical protein
MAINEYHVLMLSSLIAATLCMTVISIILSRKETYGGVLPLLFAVWMFSLAWLSVLLYIVDLKSLSFGESFIFCNKFFLISGYILFLIGVGSFSKAIAVIVRRREAEDLTKKLLKKPKITIEPETLNLASKGGFTAFIRLPEPYNIADINISTVVCEGAPAQKGTVAGDNKYIAKFDIEDLRDDLPTGDKVEMRVTGKVFYNKEYADFAGSDTIRVISKGKGKNP